ncbi:hypothetical protein PMZ80_009209 [Knufia obscura]|uniref:MOCS2A n=2 Tax=Knufia TaxID=430999 RepID=A0AAN8EKU8_9EURO|nr:hypothetical protein PMZ80_009209 [Knufia obscura]KAK5949051.1 hypothetical protein OHC33_009972 [Knufia fluminis]
MSTTQQSNTEKGTFTLLLFASAQSYCNNTESLSLSAPTTLRQLYAELETRYLGVGEKILRSSQVVINLDYVDCEWDERETKGEEVVIKAGDEVGVVPPVSAG